jgi:hypothetical protein
VDENLKGEIKSLKIFGNPLEGAGKNLKALSDFFQVAPVFLKAKAFSLKVFAEFSVNKDKIAKLNLRQGNKIGVFMKRETDWYPSTLPKQRVMYQNVKAKIDGYKTKYALTGAAVAEVLLICETFIQIDDKVNQNQATAKQMTEWRENIIKGKPAGSPVPPAPVFQAFSLPPGAFIGLEEKFRAFVRDVKNHPAYTEADGVDLMIVAPEAEEIDLETIAPDIEVTAIPNGVVTINWKKGAMTALEVQYRAIGAANWQLADKSTETTIRFTPALADNQPQKFEFRAIYLLKNERVGQWSMVHAITVG